MLTGDVALLGLDQPFAGWQLGDIGRPAAPDDPHAFLTRASGHGHRHIGRVHMPVIGRMQCAFDAVEIVKRMQLGNLFGANQLNVEPQRTTH